MTYPAAESIKEAFPTMDESEAEFTEVALFYKGFEDEQLLKLLPHDKQDLEIVIRKMDSARAEKDFKTSDFLRDVLRKVGFTVKQCGK